MVDIILDGKQKISMSSYDARVLHGELRKIIMKDNKKSAKDALGKFLKEEKLEEFLCQE